MSTIKKLQFASGRDIVEPTDLEIAGEGGSSSGVNVIANKNSADNWAASGAGVTVATTTTTSELPLYPVSTIEESGIKVTCVSGSNYAYYRWTQPPALMNMVNSIMFQMKAGSSYVSGDLKLDLYVNSASNYSGSYTRVSLNTDASSVTSIPKINGLFNSSFSADSNAYYELRITRVSGTSFIVMQEVFAGTPPLQAAPAVGAVEIQTPTLTNTGGLTITRYAQVQRIGNALHMTASMYFAGTGSSGSSLRFTFPTYNGQTITFPAGAYGMVSYRYNDTGDRQNLNGYLYVSAPSNGYFEFTIQDTPTSSPLAGTSVGVSGGSGRIYSLDLSVVLPVNEWTQSLNIGSNTVEYAAVSGTWDAASTTTAYGPSGVIMGGALTASRDKTITWQTPVLASQRIQIWGSKDQVNWFPINGAQLGSSNDPTILSVNAAGSAISGVSWRPGATAYETIVTFYRYMNVANDDSPTVDWPSSAAYWVATKANPNQPIAFGLATTGGDAGLVNPYVSGSGVVYSGTWTGATSSLSNLTSVTFQSGHYMRVGKRMMLGGHITINATGTGAFSFRCSLPSEVTSNFSSDNQIHGTFQTNGNAYVARVLSVSGTVLMIVEGSATGSGSNVEARFTAMLEIP